MLQTRKPAPRGRTEEEPRGEALDTWLFEFLVNVLGMSEDDVLALSPEAAMELYLQRVGRQAT